MRTNYPVIVCIMFGGPDDDGWETKTLINFQERRNDAIFTRVIYSSLRFRFREVTHIYVKNTEWYTNESFFFFFVDERII